jgi:hypothetical protein
MDLHALSSCILANFANGMNELMWLTPCKARACVNALHAMDGACTELTACLS